MWHERILAHSLLSLRTTCALIFSSKTYKWARRDKQQTYIWTRNPPTKSKTILDVISRYPELQCSRTRRSLSTSGKMGRIEFLEQTIPAFRFFPSIPIRKSVRGSFSNCWEFQVLFLTPTLSLSYSRIIPRLFIAREKEEIESPYFKTRGWFL